MPVPHLGTGEHRRGRPRWRIDAQSGEYVLLADRWHTCRLLRGRGPTLIYHLPSMAGLAEQSELSVATVKRALRLLADEGLIYAVTGRGTFVVPKDQRPGR